MTNSLPGTDGGTTEHSTGGVAEDAVAVITTLVETLGGALVPPWDEQLTAAIDPIPIAVTHTAHCSTRMSHSSPDFSWNVAGEGV